MATQAIRFIAPAGLTITVDVTTLGTPTALEQSALTCTADANNPLLYTTQNFTDTLAGRHAIVKKVGSSVLGVDLVDMLNANGTYDSHALNRQRETWTVVTDTVDALTLDRN